MFAEICQSCSREDDFLVDLEKCFKNAYLDAKIGFDPAENEPPKECCVLAERGCVDAEPPRPRRRGQHHP